MSSPYLARSSFTTVFAWARVMPDLRNGVAVSAPSLSSSVDDALGVLVASDPALDAVRS